MKRIAGLGACVYDTLIVCDEYPAEDTKKRAKSVFVSGGGPVGNALVVISKLGVKAEVLGAFADDTYGKYLLKDFEKYGVETENTLLLKEKTSFTSYVIVSENNATRTCVSFRGSVPDDPANVNFSAIKRADILHLDGNYLTSAIASAKYAKENDVLVSLDAGSVYPDIEKLLPLVDILIPSAEFALKITKEKDIPSAIVSLYEKYRPQVLVVTDGENGGYFYDGGTVKHYEGFKVKAVDTNGAGDTFHGAFLVAFLEGKSIKDACEFASKVASYKCTKVGARNYPLNREIAENLKL